MNDDLYIIKNRIFEEDRIEEILIALDCQHVHKENGRIAAQLPPRYESNNRRAVQVYTKPSLSSRVRNEDMPEDDIFGLVSFLKNDKHTKEEFRSDLPEAKKWICNTLGYTEYLRRGFPVAQRKTDPLQWIKDMRKNKRKVHSRHSNPILDSTILEEYVQLPSQRYFVENITIDTQQKFNVGFDVFSKRITFPVHNVDGELIGIKGRTINDDYKELNIPKFLYIYNCNKSIEFYNLHRALPYILELKEVIIFEAEKSCWIADQYGYFNTIAIGGTDITQDQVEILKKLGVEVKIVLAYDKDKDQDNVLFQAQKFGKSRLLYALYDHNNLLEDKDAPVDKGKRTFKKLYEQYQENRIYI